MRKINKTVLAKIRCVMSGERIDKIIYILLLILAFFCCTWELPARHAARLAIIFMVFKVCLYPAASRNWKKIKLLICTMSLFFFMLLFEIYYGGYGWNWVSDYTYWYNYNMLLLLVATIAFLKTTQCENIIFSMGLSTVCMDFWIGWQFFHGVSRPVSSIINTPMMTAVMYSLTIPAIMVLIIRTEGHLRRMIYFAIFSLDLVGVIMTATRGAWLAIAVTGLAMIIYSIKYFGKKKVCAATVALIITLGGIFYVHPYFQARFVAAFDTSNLSNQARLNMYKSAYNMFIDHPLFGVGIDNYPEQYEKKYMLPAEKTPFLHAHSNYMHFLAEDGLFGLLSYLGMIGSFIYVGFKRRRSMWGVILMSSVISFSIYALVDYTLHGYAGMRVLWLLVAIAVAGLLAEEVSQGECKHLRNDAGEA